MANAKAKPEIDTYTAVRGVHLAAPTQSAESAYKIEVRFLAGLTETQKNAFKKAADRWSEVIVGDVPSVLVGGEVIDDLVIEAQGTDIDGPGGILGQAGPTNLRPASAGASAFLPAKGIMSFDTADLAQMEADGTLVDVITHEMGHVIGIGTVWEQKGLLTGKGTNNPRFTGATAKKAFGELKGQGPTAVPVENTGGAGTRDSHWRETVFKNELMSGFIAAPNNPISMLTVAQLGDLGYVVDMDAAEPYKLPNLADLAERGLMIAAPLHVHALPILAPKVLPDGSLV
ncbi:leishmanolysin-related zinc metalloendopeptidase [Mycolicibacterium mengxianglii]|uniref:leishmanolysin-related zinc metalloendopeptidase n=1 Tax=Mycolicibacterium mengxianglii TaxID=2736649 RepID=UPI0018EED213|nr:leishmanolysin-related zinc metalloendopeptidase [Mycolicibacterium mengxianglii]